MIKKLIIYILVFLLLLVVFVLLCHYISLNKKSSNIEILQGETPDFNKIQTLINQNQPTIFRQVLYGWEPIIHIFDASLDDINYLVKNNPEFNQDLLMYLSDYSMFLSLGWEYKFSQKSIKIKDNNFILQRNYRQLFAQIMGTQRFYLIDPSQSKYIDKKLLDDKTIVSKVNFWNAKETAQEPFNKIQYLEIILREGNILFIPKGWWYLKVVEEESLSMTASNISVFSFFNF
tara:strand:- start:692 stop:1387 length:696 start_codon:yes stop_codon:yes gene_type:complete